MDAYVTGDKNSSNVLVCIFDIFGFWNTTKQGADLLGDSMKTKIVMPDLFRNRPWPIDGFPPRDEAEDQKLSQWFESVGNFGERAKDVRAVVDELKSNGAQKLGLYGLCWGGNVAVQLAGKDSPFVGVSIIHPAFLSPDDAKGFTVPVSFFPSKVEPKNDADGFWATMQKEHPDLAAKSQYKYYDENHHGFAAARANLEDKSNYFAFQDLYTRLADFFCPLFQ